MIISDLEDLHQNFADYLNSTPLAADDPLYAARTRLFNRSREDIAKRYFLKSLLKSDTITIQANVPTYQLPLDCERFNGLKSFITRAGGINYTDPYQKSATLVISRNFTTGGYQVTITPTPTSVDIADIAYFATPPPLVNPSDLVLVDGDAVLYFALKEHWFLNDEQTKWQIAANEYEGRIDELIKANAIEVPGSLAGMGNYQLARGWTTNETTFYSSGRRRSY